MHHSQLYMFCLQRIIQSYEYTDVLHTSPALNSIMMIVGDVAKGTKYMFQTTHVSVTNIFTLISSCNVMFIDAVTNYFFYRIILKFMQIQI